MRQATIVLIVMLGLGVAACDTGSKPPSQGQAKPAEKTIDIIKPQRDALEKSKAVQGTLDAVVEDRQKSLEQSEGK